jgi:hypothetical protein
LGLQNAEGTIGENHNPCGAYFVFFAQRRAAVQAPFCQASVPRENAVAVLRNPRFFFVAGGCMQLLLALLWNRFRSLQTALASS